MIAQLGLNTKIPYHFLFWGVAFGGSSFYSFIVSPLVFKKLPREEFSNLQTQVFPTYFSGQIVAPIILGLTSPLKLALSIHYWFTCRFFCRRIVELLLVDASLPQPQGEEEQVDC